MQLPWLPRSLLSLFTLQPECSYSNTSMVSLCLQHNFRAASKPYAFSPSLHSRRPLFPPACSLCLPGTGDKGFLTQPYKKAFKSVVPFQVKLFTPTGLSTSSGPSKSCSLFRSQDKVGVLSS